MIRSRPLTVALGAGVLLVAALAGLGMFDRTDNPTHLPASVRCRDAHDPAVVKELPRVVAKALSAEGSALRGVALGVPSVRDATWAASEVGTATHALAICGGREPHSLYLLLEEDRPVDHCYGPSASCPRSKTVRLTCYVGLDGGSHQVTHPESCLDPVGRDSVS